MIRNDIVRAAAVDPSRVDREAVAFGAGEAQRQVGGGDDGVAAVLRVAPGMGAAALDEDREIAAPWPRARQGAVRSEEHTSELQSLMRISYAVFCLKKKNKKHMQAQA